MFGDIFHSTVSHPRKCDLSIIFLGYTILQAHTLHSKQREKEHAQLLVHSQIQNTNIERELLGRCSSFVIASVQVPSILSQKNCFRSFTQDVYLMMSKMQVLSWMKKNRY